MENASRALIMAASVLLAVMVITVGVALFNSFAGSGRRIIEKLDEKENSEFNANFYKYYGQIDGEYIKVTAHDIVTVANNAKENNIRYGAENETSFSENSYYVQVQVEKNTNFEKKDEQYYTNFIKNNMLTEDDDNKKSNTKYYVCKNIITSKKTGRVIFIKFEEKK